MANVTYNIRPSADNVQYSDYPLGNYVGINTPDDLSATASGTAATIVWTDVNSGAAQYVLYRSDDGGATYSQVTILALGVSTYTDTGLTAGSYTYAVKALRNSVFSAYSNTDSVTIAGSGSGSLIWTSDLAGAMTAFAAVSGVTSFRRVTSNPRPGKTYALRVNLKPGITDPITLQAGSGLTTCNLVAAVNAWDYNELTIVLPFRLDDCLWGTQSGDSTAWSGKLVYIAHRGRSSQEGFYLAGGMGGVNGSLNWGDNLIDSSSPWDGWETRSYGWRSSNGTSPQLTANGNTGINWGTDGQWHILKLQFVFNYTDSLGTYTRARALIDDHPTVGAVPRNFTAEGWTRLPPEFNPHVIRMGYGDNGNSSATDRTGIAAGLQWDDAEYYSGIV